MSTPNKEIALFPVLVGRREVENNRPGSGPLRNVQEACRGLFQAKEIEQQSNTRDPEALIPEENQKAYQDAPKIGRELEWAHMKML